MAEWLLALGAEVTGFALPPPTQPSLFGQLGLASRLRHIEGDVRDLAAVRAAMAEAKPDFVFHLAAQPLVRLSYDQPVETYATNVMGTVNVLEALRLYQNESTGLRVEGVKGSEPVQPFNSSAVQPRSGVLAAVMITTDKCYDNKEWVHSYREEDPMGGYDPYSSSKGAAELVIASYRRSYFQGKADSGNAETLKIRVASARAGNVIGGGDWALDRIVPDCIRALSRGETISVRNKIATRPWQHVLEPLSGYLWLGAALAQSASRGSEGLAVEGLKGSDADSAQRFNDSTIQPAGFRFPSSTYASAFNFGPALASNRTVADLVQELLKHWPGKWEDKSDPRAVHEAKLLNLATDKAHHLLGWAPAWNFGQTIEKTAEWYRQSLGASSDIHALTLSQIAAYTSEATTKGVTWAV